MHIKLITYNIWHGTCLDKVIDFIHMEQPDILCLQEVSVRGRGFKATGENILATIQEKVEMNAVYAPLYEREVEEGLIDIGVSILSKESIEKSEVWAYAGGFKHFQIHDDYYHNLPSVLLMAKIRGLSVPVTTTHLPVTDEGQSTPKQQAQADELQTYLEKYAEVILTGDMNTTKGTKTYELISKGLTDVSHAEEPTLHPTIHKAGNKGYHVDYVFYKSGRIKHVSTRIPVVDGSDHLPVIVELEIKNYSAKESSE